MAKRYSPQRVFGPSPGGNPARQTAGDDRRRQRHLHKFIQRGGVDILGVYNTGYFRMQGYGSLAGMLPMADANQMVFDIGRREVLPQVKETPVIAGLSGVDVLRDMPTFLEECKRIGFSGVHNFPTVGWFDGEFRRTLEARAWATSMKSTCSIRPGNSIC